MVAADLAATTPMTREVSVTFDDLPTVPLAVPLERQQTNIRDLLATIRKYNVPAIGFVNEGKLNHPAKIKLIEQWLDAGLEVGNHTFSHPDLHRIDVAQYERDIANGERVIRPLLRKRGRELRWFRHPFLHTGTSLETRTRIETFLRKRGVRVAPITLDNSEWIFARAYENAIARGDNAMKERLGREYIAYMDRKLAYFEQQSIALFGRNIRHTLLVHASTLNADWFDELAESMRQRGYTFISIDRAMEDPAYQSKDAYVGPAGLTWIHRWAITQNKPKAFFAGEPKTAQWVLEAAGMDSE